MLQELLCSLSVCELNLKLLINLQTWHICQKVDGSKRYACHQSATWRLHCRLGIVKMFLSRRNTLQHPCLDFFLNSTLLPLFSFPFSLFPKKKKKKRLFCSLSTVHLPSPSLSILDIKIYFPLSQTKGMYKGFQWLWDNKGATIAEVRPASVWWQTNSCTCIRAFKAIIEHGASRRTENSSRLTCGFIALLAVNFSLCQNRHDRTDQRLIGRHHLLGIAAVPS